MRKEEKQDVVIRLFEFWYLKRPFKGRVHLTKENGQYIYFETIADFNSFKAGYEAGILSRNLV